MAILEDAPNLCDTPPLKSWNLHPFPCNLGWTDVIRLSSRKAMAVMFCDFQVQVQKYYVVSALCSWDAHSGGSQPPCKKPNSPDSAVLDAGPSGTSSSRAAKVQRAPDASRGREPSWRSSAARMTYQMMVFAASV